MRKTLGKRTERRSHQLMPLRVQNRENSNTYPSQKGAGPSGSWSWKHLKTKQKHSNTGVKKAKHKINQSNK